ncbi:MAG: holo-ACP synthase [Myxococcota bacterium]
MPLVATGLEVISIERLRGALARRGEALRLRLFTPAELAYADARADPVPPLAARLAAKLAVRRALRDDRERGPRLREIEVVSRAGAAPGVRLVGRARPRGEGLSISLSLTHEAGLALGSVHIERSGPGAAGGPQRRLARAKGSAAESR